MAYELQDGESLRVGLRRCAREQLESAIEELTEGIHVDPVRAVHDARKSLKKERSLLRLARGSLRPAERRREAAALREAARKLGAARDADVMIQTLDGLAERYSGQLPKTTFARIRKRLATERRRARLELKQSDSTGEVVEDLRAALLRVEDWRGRHEGWPAIDEGLLRSYRRGRKAFKCARAAPTGENFHQWRKRCKDLWYHLRLLQPISPHTMAAHAEDAHHLSDLLGDEHDLALLREILVALSSQVPADSEAVVGLIDHRRDELRTEALFLGRRLYAEAPKAFLRRVHRYFNTWRAQSLSSAAVEG